MTKRESDPAQGLNAAVAAELNGERVSAGMTFDQLADVSGISKQQLMRLLSTKRRHIDVEVLALLAGVFHTSSAQIVAAAQERMTRPGWNTSTVLTPAEEEEARAAMRAAMAELSPPSAPEPRKSSRTRRRTTN